MTLNCKTSFACRTSSALRLLVRCALLACVICHSAVADDASNDDPYGINSVPKVAQDIGVDSKLGDILDPDVAFHDEENRFVRIGQYFGDKPIMLSFNYSNCPKLCSVQLENMISTLAQVKFKVGKDFDMVSVSIDPLEQVSRARDSKQKYVRMYNEGESVDGFHFLTGGKDEIKYLTELCGFRYKYVPEQKLYSHPPVFILVSPKGKIVRYIHGLDYDPGTIEKALIETAEGKIGSPINRLSFALGCFVFDETKGKYTFQAMFLMRLGGILTILGLVIGILPYWLLRKNSTPDTANEPEPIDTQAELHPLS